MFKTASFHITKPCNMKCKFCYATFEDFKVSKMLTLSQCKSIVYKLYLEGLEKITFAGGEPMIFKDLDKLIKYSKSLGLTTSLITNGSFLTKDWISDIEPYLDWMGISIDSLNSHTNRSIGRTSKLNIDYTELFNLLKCFDFNLKVNTVVNNYNKNEILVDFIKQYEIKRWKIFQALKVKGQNDKNWNEIKVTTEEFNNYLLNNKYDRSVPEDNKLMTGSYLLIDPLGRLFENSKGRHTYSESILNITVKSALKQISLNKKTFLDRGGIYNW